MNLSAFGAVGEESKTGTLYRTIEWPSKLAAIWVATRIPSVPWVVMGWRGFFIFRSLPRGQDLHDRIKDDTGGKNQCLM